MSANKALEHSCSNPATDYAGSAPIRDAQRADTERHTCGSTLAILHRSFTLTGTERRDGRR